MQACVGSAKRGRIELIVIPHFTRRLSWLPLAPFAPRLTAALGCQHCRGDVVLRITPRIVGYAMRKSFICTVPFLLLSVTAKAQSPTTMVEEFGLLGTWAIDCAQSP